MSNPTELELNAYDIFNGLREDGCLDSRVPMIDDWLDRYFRKTAQQEHDEKQRS